jgi:hypothetical protein
MMTERVKRRWTVADVTNWSLSSKKNDLVSCSCVTVRPRSSLTCSPVTRDDSIAVRRECYALLLAGVTISCRLGCNIMIDGMKGISKFSAASYRAGKGQVIRSHSKRLLHMVVLRNDRV